MCCFTCGLRPESRIACVNVHTQKGVQRLAADVTQPVMWTEEVSFCAVAIGLVPTVQVGSERTRVKN